ncbi:NAD(P)-dependent dehydrogenase, short-chain alcohol dehydrogenase family [Nocardia amikacinitolerans]|uniref:NAD(P)-dependent dehydrogenase, short-chain alcohol dehydrogenase family n=1 Tax=Nocardia amikacinitolerans TaxID=756689 RepID=A0A285LMD3_9NOCA|nr:SDR family NAD(P)-dependent oxidoreductase [Nocardia amikacinitolerans]SNY84796.1 NAD(P)-dependent dehydrogenase, short-chain alcohol dehydrogenase family [Nocardia amikacinitolerans]
MFEPLSAARITMVTGVDTPLGFATARRLAADGAAVILHATDKERAEEVLEALVQTGIPVARLHIVHADFSKLTEVDELAATLAATVPCLHALINASSIPGGERRSRTADGYETTLQINYLAPQRLIAALAPAVAAARGRVVTVSSPLHVGGTVDYSDLDRNRGIYTPMAVYAQFKLALTMFTRTLAETGPEGLTAVSVHPADFEIDMPQLRSHVDAPMDDAADLLAMYSASGAPVVNGGYYEGTRPARPAALVRNSRARARLAAWTNQQYTTA